MVMTFDTALIAALVFGVIALGTKPLIALLQRIRLLDHPNERSSHHRPTPVGGGLLIVAALVPAWLWLGGDALVPLALAALGLAAISLVDDFRRVPTGLRFAGHVAAVAWVLSLNPALAGWLPDAVPAPVALIGVGLGWVWFINLFISLTASTASPASNAWASGPGLSSSRGWVWCHQAKPDWGFIWPPPPPVSLSGTGIRPRFSWVMSAASRSAFSSAGCCWKWRPPAPGRRRLSCRPIIWPTRR